MTVLKTLVTAIVMMVPLVGGAAVVERIGMAEMTQLARQVVQGTVMSRTGRYQETPGGRRIVTDVTIRVERVLRGGPDEPDSVVVTTLGGVVDGQGQLVPGAPRLAEGDEVVLFLVPSRPAPDESPRLAVIGLSQGAFHLSRDPVSGTVRATRRLHGLTFVGGDPEGVPSDQMVLDDLVRRIQTEKGAP